MGCCSLKSNKQKITQAVNNNIDQKSTNQIKPDEESNVKCIPKMANQDISGYVRKIMLPDNCLVSQNTNRIQRRTIDNRMNISKEYINSNGIKQSYPSLQQGHTPQKQQYFQEQNYPPLDKYKNYYNNKYINQPKPYQKGPKLKGYAQNDQIVSQLLKSEQQQQTKQQVLPSNNRLIYSAQKILNGLDNKDNHLKYQDLGFKKCYSNLNDDYLTPVPTPNLKQQNQPKQLADWVWPGGIIPYTIDESFTLSMRSNLAKAIQEFKEKTPIQFVQISYNQEYDQYIKYYRNQEDTSYVLWVGRSLKYSEHPVYLNINCGYSTYLHEIMHVLGFEHEQCRKDRDKYVKVQFTENDSDLLKFQYQKMGFMISKYDNKSIMHYYCNKNMQPQDKYKHLEFGNAQNLSEGDIKGLKLIYGEIQCTYDVYGEQKDILVLIILILLFAGLVVISVKKNKQNETQNIKIKEQLFLKLRFNLHLLFLNWISICLTLYIFNYFQIVLLLNKISQSNFKLFQIKEDVYKIN